MPSNAFNVYNSKGRLIDTVFSTDTDALEVKRSLVNHDGYDPCIKVTKVRKAKKAAPKDDFVQVGPVPPYDHKTDGDYSAWLVANNID
jgi:hypothetical protein